MKDVLFVIPTLRLGGAEKALISLLNSLDSSLLNVDLFLFEGGGVLQNEVPEWVNIIVADDVTKAMTLEARFYLKSIIKKGKVLAAVSRLWTSILSKTGHKVFAWNIVKKHIPEVNKKYDVAIGFLEGTTDFFVIDKVQAKSKIGWIHPDLTERTCLKQEIDYYNKFDYIVTVSEKCRESACRKIPGIENKTIVLENLVIPDDIIRKSYEDTDIKWKDCFNILTVGRLEYDKGIDIGAQTAKILVARGIDFEWHILGYGSQESIIRNYITDNNLQDVYKLDGMVSNPYPYMRKADVIVQPSRNEGKSIVLDEAKILGKAIVVTDYSSVRDQITDHKTGIIVDKSPDSIADGIVMIRDNRDLKTELENNSRIERMNNNVMLNYFYHIIGIV